MRKTGIWAVLCAAGLSMGVSAETGETFWQHRIETEQPLPATPPQVWSLLMDFERHPHWNPFIRQIQGMAQAGQTLKVRVQSTGGSEMAFEPEVLVVQAPTEFRWKGQWLVPGLFDGEHYFLLRPSADGQTLLVHGERFSGLLVPFFRGQLNRGTLTGFKAMNEALRQELLKTRASR